MVKFEKEPVWVNPELQDIPDFVRGINGCRRVVLDSVMDGISDRLGCQIDEEPCDLCERNQGIQKERDMVKNTDRTESYEAMAQIASIQQNQSTWQQRVVRQDIQREAEEVEQLKQWLRDWDGICMICWWEDGFTSIVRHPKDICPREENVSWQRLEEIEKTIYTKVWEKKEMASYGGCFICGVPQVWCEKWVRVRGEEGKFYMDRKGKCQWNGLVVRLLASSVMWYNEEVNKCVWEEMEKKGLYQGEDIWKWLRSRVEWGGIITNGLCRTTYFGLRIIISNNI
jgi:hypothetical protein